MQTSWIIKVNIPIVRKTLILSCLLVRISCLSQDKENNLISFKIPILWNTIEVNNVYGPQRKITGTGLEFRLNASIEKYFYKPLFFQIGLGYFKNKFFLRRPFTYDTPYLPLYTTKSYSYQGVNIDVGLGYKQTLNNHYSLKCRLIYSLLHTFKQVYVPASGDPPQVNKLSYVFAHSLISSVGINRNIGNKYILSIDFILPIQTSWKKDNIFREDDTRIYHPKQSFGCQLTLSRTF